MIVCRRKARVSYYLVRNTFQMCAIYNIDQFHIDFVFQEGYQYTTHFVEASGIILAW
jgi:hypothetical protein